MVVHGHSLGGLVGAMFAGRVPDRVERLVLTSAPLPGLPDPPPFPGAWRVGLRVGRPVADVLVGTGLRLKADAWRRRVNDAITAPTLLLWGADDRVIPQRLIEDVEAAHPGWSSRTIDGVGHLLPWESPEEYVELAG